MERFRDFYTEHKTRLFNYLMRMTGEVEAAKDLMQESFTRYLEKYDERPRDLALLYTIARNAFLDNLRKQGRYCHLDENKEPLSEDREHNILVRDEYRRVLSAMSRLESSERDILSLVISGDLSYKKIASITGFSEAAVKVKVHRARLKLRKTISEGEKK